jgi:hypothetical protein
MSGEAAWLRKINWRHEAILPAQAVAETCLIAPWLASFLSMSRDIQPEHVAGACLALILGTLYLARMMDALRVNQWIQRSLILLIIMGLTAWVVYQVAFGGPQWVGRGGWRALLDPNYLVYLAPGTLIVLLSVTWLCWRGLRLANMTLSVREAALGFQVGVIVLSLVALVSTVRYITAFVPAFFFSQLLAVALTRVETVSYVSGGKRLPSSGWWVTVLLGSTGVVILVAGAVSAFVLGLPPDQLFFWLVPFIALITLPLLLLSLPFMGLLERIARTLLTAFMSVVGALTTLAQQLQALRGQMTHFEPSALIVVVLRVIGYGIGLLIILLALAVVVSVVRIAGRRHTRADNEEGEQHESTWSSRELLRKLRARLLNRLAQLRNLAGIMDHFGASGLFAALTIRRIYAQTIRLAASHGYPRPAARTPYEHLATLGQAFPGCELELFQLTEAYVGVHYGELPERTDALIEIHAAFERIKAQAAATEKLRSRPGVES